MKILLDENLPHDLRHLVVGHDVFTVTYMGWSGVTNGELLRLAAGAGFDAMVTKDTAMETQQHEKQLPLAVFILEAPSNDLADIEPLVPVLLAALARLDSRVFVRIKA